ncbi:MAG: hypothetical protein A2X08_00070 [Bacteroidetes bacterium GWA2_32_17]|nr:MAG: hypothetical protein A2X08_00070 [Bacteroidetes bacterium GWA2_32_17]
MKKYFSFFFSILSLNCFTQNLVHNPSFESYTLCPYNWTQLSYCQFWNSYGGTPDYYNICSTNPNITPPNCYFGFQYPHTGSAYAGFYIYLSNAQNAREFIGAPLLTTIIVGQKYFVSFYVNRGGQNEASIATNKIGVKFSTTTYSESYPANINNISTFYNDTIITDTTKWTKISGSFIADSAYSNIIIGNFFNDSLTDTLNFSTLNHFAYYFIDDVCVSTDSLYCENWLGVKEQNVNKEEITIYPNPCTNELNVKYNNIPNEQITISIINIFGKIVMQAKTQANEYIFNTGKLAKGLYLVKVETGGIILQQRVVKE